MSLKKVFIAAPIFSSAEMAFNIRIEANHYLPCIQVIDRTPFDPLAYAENIKDKKSIMTSIYKASNKEVELQKGEIILLDADAKVAYHRLNKRNPGQYGIDFFLTKREKFKNIFGNSQIIYIDTSNLSVGEVVKRIAYNIYFHPYQEIDLEKTFLCYQ